MSRVIFPKRRPMSEFYLRNVIEAALLAAGRPLKREELAQLFDESARPSEAALREATDALAAEYAGRGIELKETASGLRIQVRREFAAEVSRLWPERPARYSRALLETLALIAYRQPITRGEIEDVRGVAVNPNIIKTLLERNWVRVVGHRDVPGRPELLGTTRDFLDYFGLTSLDQLPPLSQLKAVGDLNLQLDLPAAGRADPHGPEQAAADGSEGADGSEAADGSEEADAAPACGESDSWEGESVEGREDSAERGEGEAFDAPESSARKMLAASHDASE